MRRSLPLLLVQAVCHQDAMPFASALGSQCANVGWGYVALGSAAMQILMLPVADWLLAAKPAPDPAADATDAPMRTASGNGSSSGSKGIMAKASSEPAGMDSLSAYASHEFTVIVLSSSAPLPATEPAPEMTAAAEQQAPEAVVASCWRRAGAFVRRFYLQPACLVPAVALGVACIEPLRSLLVPQTVRARFEQSEEDGVTAAATRPACWPSHCSCHPAHAILPTRRPPHLAFCSAQSTRYRWRSCL